MRPRLIISLLLLPIIASLAVDGAVSHYNRGNQAYREGEYRSAIESYRAAIDAGAVDWRVYYNLGNAYFRVDEIGEAILNWERAKHLQPRNEDINENLDFARSTRVDVVREGEGGPRVSDIYENTFLGFFYDFLGKFSPHEFKIALIVLSLLATIFLALWLLVRGGFRGFSFWASAIFWALFIITGVLFLLKQDNIWETDKAIVIRPGAEIRSASYSNSQLLYTFQEGMEIAELEVRNGYSLIKLRNGEEGWVPGEYIERVLPR